jgi:hypothetical protein
MGERSVIEGEEIGARFDNYLADGQATSGKLVFGG